MVRSWPDLRLCRTAELIEFLALAASVWLCMVRARRCPRSARLSELTVKGENVYQLSSLVHQRSIKYPWSRRASRAVLTSVSSRDDLAPCHPHAPSVPSDDRMRHPTGRAVYSRSDKP